jgi:hypothetical protein
MDVVVNKHDDYADVNGIFEFGDDKRRICRRMRLLRRGDIIEEFSNCGQIVLAVRVQNNGNDYPLTHYDLRGAVGPEERIKTLLLDHLKVVCNGTDRPDFHMVVQRAYANYRRFFKDYPGLRNKMTLMTNEPWFLSQAEAYQIDFANGYAQRMRLAIRTHCAQTGKDFDNHMWWSKVFSFIAWPRWEGWTYRGDNVVYDVAFDRCGLAPPVRRIAQPCSRAYYRRQRLRMDEKINENIVQYPDVFTDKKFPQARLQYEIEPEQNEPPPVEVMGFYTHLPLVIPAGDSETLARALWERMLFEREVDVPAVTDFFLHGIRMINEMNTITIEEVDFEEWLLRYPESRREALREARKKIPDDKDALAEIFAKMEPYLGKNTEDAKPRMIWKRTDTYLAWYGPWFWKLSKELAKMFSDATNFYYCSSGTPESVGAYGQTMEDLYTRFFESDVSNWDGSMMPWFLALEVYFLQTRVNGDPLPYSDWLYANWFNVSGCSADRQTRVHMSHGRESGTPQTSAFNTLLNFIVTTWAMKKDWSSNVMMICLGDDNLVACDDEIDVETLTNSYRSIGLKVEIIPRTYVSQSTFCSGYFWKVDGQYIWGNKPFRALTKWGVNYHNHPKKMWNRLLAGNAKGGLSSGGFIPIYGKILRCIADDADKHNIKPFIDPRDTNPHKITGGNVYYPSYDTYIQFSQIYGISVEEILAIEEQIDVSLVDFPMLLEGEWIDGAIFKDIGEMVNENLTLEETVPVVENQYHELVYRVPMREELEKLALARQHRRNPLVEAYHYGLEEHQDGAPWINVMMHVLFTAASMVNIRLGVHLHAYYNAGQIALFGLETQTVCVRGKNRVLKTNKVVVKTRATPRRRRRRQKRRGKLRDRAYVSSSYLKVMANPFDPTIFGVRLPDSFAFPTATWPMRNLFTPTVDATNTKYLAAIYTPWMVTTQYQPGSISSGGVVSWSGGTTTAAGQNAIFSSIVTAYRTVAWGIRIAVESSLSNTDGHIIITQFPQDLNADVVGWTDLWVNEKQADSCIVGTKYPLYELCERPIIVNAKRVDESSYRFRDVGYPSTASPYAETNSGWCIIAIYCHGSAQNPAISVETFHHVEYIPDGNGTNDYAVGSMTPCAPDQKALEDGAKVQMGAPVAYQEDELMEEKEEPMAMKFYRMGASLSQLAKRSGADRAFMEYASSRAMGYLRSGGRSYLALNGR